MSNFVDDAIGRLPQRVSPDVMESLETNERRAAWVSGIIAEYRNVAKVSGNLSDVSTEIALLAERVEALELSVRRKLVRKVRSKK